MSVMSTSVAVKSTSLESKANFANASGVDETAKEIGRRVASLRARDGLTVQGLADVVDVSRNAVMAWEKGTSVPDTARLIRLADHFHVTLDALVGRADLPPPTDIQSLATRVAGLEGDMASVSQFQEAALEAILALLDVTSVSEQLRPRDAQRLRQLIDQLRLRSVR